MCGEKLISAMIGLRNALVIVLAVAILLPERAVAIDALGVEELARSELEGQGKDMNGRKLSSKDHRDARQARVLEREEKLKRMAEEEYGKAKKLAKNASSRKITSTPTEMDEEDAHKPLTFPERVAASMDEADPYSQIPKRFEEEVERRIKEMEKQGYDLDRELEFGTLPDLGSVSQVDKVHDPELDPKSSPLLDRPTLKSVSPIDELSLDPDVDHNPTKDHEEPVLDIETEMAKVVRDHTPPDVGVDLAPEIPEVDNNLLFLNADIEPPEPEDIVPPHPEGFNPEDGPVMDEPESDAEALFQAATKVTADATAARLAGMASA